jgi:hypothetical protein
MPSLDDRALRSLEAFLDRVPTVQKPVGKGSFEDGCPWTTFRPGSIRMKKTGSSLARFYAERPMNA